MKHFFKIAFFVFLFCRPISASSLNDSLNFYVGTDAQLRTMRFKKGFGNNILKNKFPQANIYAGFKVSDYIALELGHEATDEVICDSTLVTGECCAGRHVHQEMSPAAFKTKLRLKGPYAALVLFHPIEGYPINLLASFGVSSVKGTAECKTVWYGNPPKQGSVRTMSKHKAAFRFMGGAQYLTESRIGFRGTVGFVRTRKIVIKKSDEHPSINIPMIKLKDSLVYGLGLFWVF